MVLKDRERIRAYLEQNKTNMLEDVLALVAIQGSSEDRVATMKALDKALEIAGKLGFVTEKRANGEVGLVSFGEGTETLGILAHVDVVPLGDLGEWKVDPAGEIIGDILYGRGVVDDRGPYIAALYALAAVKSLGIQIHKKVEIIIGTREEITWKDMYAYLDAGYKLPDYGFTPDGAFPIVNREKGYIEVFFHFANEELNESGVEVIQIGGGNALNSVPGKAKICLRGPMPHIEAAKNISIVSEAGEITIQASGVEVHSSQPWEGKNAIAILFEALNNTNFKNDAFNKMGKFIREKFGDDKYEGVGFGFKPYPTVVNGEDMGCTTVVPATLEMDENGVKIGFSIRIIYGTTREDASGTLDRLKEEYGFTYEITDWLDPLYVSKNHKFIQILSDSYEEITGEVAQFQLTGGTTYAKAMPNTVAFGPLFPDDMATEHQANEQISIKTLMKSSEIYAKVLYRVLGSVDTLN